VAVWTEGVKVLEQAISMKIVACNKTRTTKCHAGLTRLHDAFQPGDGCANSQPAMWRDIGTDTDGALEQFRCEIIAMAAIGILVLPEDSAAID